jgi:hypothetical protein
VVLLALICTCSIIMGSKPFYISNLNSFTRLYCIHFYTLCINMRRFCKMQDYENSNAKSLSLWPQCLLHTAISSYFVHASTFFVHCLNYQVCMDRCNDTKCSILLQNWRQTIRLALQTSQSLDCIVNDVDRLHTTPDPDSFQIFKNLTMRTVPGNQEFIILRHYGQL